MPLAHQPGTRQRVTVVIATRNRAVELCRTLNRLAVLPERPPVIVVDNASNDATAQMVREWHPSVDLVVLPENRGVAARTLGARRAGTPYVAFSDDDSWWAPGALARAADLLDDDPCLGLVAGRTLVGPEQLPDPVDWPMLRSPLTRSPLTRSPLTSSPLTHSPPAPADPPPGSRVLGFLACASVVRREAFLVVGGFAPVLLVGAEERLLAYSLREAGWDLAYAHDVVAHHHPSNVRNPALRRTLVYRNDLIIDILRRPWPAVLARTAALLAAAGRDPAARSALVGAARLLPGVLRGRRPLPAPVEADARKLDLEGGLGVIPAA